MQETTGEDSRSRYTPRSACERCRGRKIKCSGERPSCSRCARMDKSCLYAAPPAKSAYVLGLEETINRLETERIEQSNHSSGRKRRLTDTSVNGSSSYMTSDFVPSPAEETQLPSNAQLLRHLTSGIDLQPFICDTQDDEATPMTVDFDFTILPTPQDTSELLAHFQNYTNSTFPIMHYPSLLDRVSAMAEPFNRARVEDVCIVLMVLAVSATSLHRDEALFSQYKARAPVFWQAAQQYLSSATSRSGLLRLQILLLQLQYVLYCPSAGNVWDLSGAAVRVAVDLGLHHDTMQRGGSAMDRDLGQRLFWSAYSIDRNLCVALGRPPGIPEEWITALMPAICDDRFITHKGIHSNEPSPFKEAALHHFRIRRIQSEIQRRLFTSQTPNPPPLDWYINMLAQLDDWRDSCPGPTGFASHHWFKLNYHLTKTLLYRTAPGNSTPGREALRNALESSSATMRIYKEMYRLGRINYAWLATYHLFMAGVTYLNSLWHAQRNGWRLVPSLVDALLDIQVCTVVMEGIATTTPGTMGIRNAFEKVTERIIRTLSAHDRASKTPMPGSPVNQPTILPNETDQSYEPGPGLWQEEEIDFSSLFDMQTDNPLDSFLLHPLGEISNLDWEWGPTTQSANESGTGTYH